MDWAKAGDAVGGGRDAHEVARELVALMTEDERLRCLSGDGPFWAGITYMAKGGYHRCPFPAVRVERLGIPGFAFSDGPRGVVIDRATCYPVSMARGATWDLDLEERIGDAIGKELRAIGATLYGGVCVNILRHPAWGRAQETYGEDPHHVGEMGAALTRGVQRHAMACVKHFACNSMENSRFRVDVEVDEEALHEVYLPHFRRIVAEGVAAVMSAYNSVNGEWCGQNEDLLTGVLRDEWGFDGFVISDWIFGLRDAVKSVKSGLDIEMPYRMVRGTGVREALDSGALSWADVDGAVERVMATLLRFDDVLSAPAPPVGILACDEHRALAREAASKSVVLLRNETVAGSPVLPLDAGSLGSLAVVGGLASAVNLGDAGSSDVWVPDAVTVLDGLRAALPGVTVSYDDGDDPAVAASTADGADAAIVVVGYTYADEGEFIGNAGDAFPMDLFPPPDDPAEAAAFEEEVAKRRAVKVPQHVKDRPESQAFGQGGDRTSLRLHPEQVDLIRAVVAANPRTAVVIVAGSAVVISDWDDVVPAVAQSWYGGMEAGAGLADVLLGHTDASGRLPFSVPFDEADLPPFEVETGAFTYDLWHGWWHLDRNGAAPAYPFGFGLGYTTFELSGATVGTSGGTVRVVANLCNTGGRPGSDVVQVYARRVDGDHPPRLVGFARCDLAAGQEAEIVIDVPIERLAERDVEAHAMLVKPGEYEFRVARNATDPGCACTVTVAG